MGYIEQARIIYDSKLNTDLNEKKRLRITDINDIPEDLSEINNVTIFSECEGNIVPEIMDKLKPACQLRSLSIYPDIKHNESINAFDFSCWPKLTELKCSFNSGDTTLSINAPNVKELVLQNNQEVSPVEFYLQPLVQIDFQEY